MEIHFAPLQGYTDHHYRKLHAQIYGATDACYTPFIRIEKGEPRRQDMTRLAASAGDGTNLVPQIIFGSFDEFTTLAEAVKGAGYDRVDLNLGCPYPMQTRKGRGTAMLNDLDTMHRVAEYISGDSATYSVKMRLGQNAPDEWRALMPILNDLSLRHITVHPRIATQMYGGELFRDEFAEVLKASKNPVIWNGDISSVSDINALGAEFPELKGVMIGRGLLARPSLAEEWKCSCELSADERMAKLLEFHQLLFDAYKETLCGQAQILQKIKPFWDYLEPEIGHKAAKQIRKASNLDRYQAAVDSLGC